MNELALKLPWGTTADIQPMVTIGPNASIPSASFGGLVSGFLNIAFMAAGFLMLFWMAWGIFEYIFSGGEKEAAAKGRKRITWAIVGFLIIMLAFALSQFIRSIFPDLMKTDPNQAIIEQGVTIPTPPEVK